MTKLLRIVVLSIFIITMFSVAFAAENITITTYFPSPFGSFQELRTSRMSVSPARAMPTTDGTLAWGNTNNRGLLNTDNGSSIELGGSSNPYIDFSNDDSASSYDARISLLDDNTLRIYANMLVIRNQPNSNWGDIRVKCMKYNSFLINPVAGFGDICAADLQIIN